MFIPWPSRCRSKEKLSSRGKKQFLNIDRIGSRSNQRVANLPSPIWFVCCSLEVKQRIMEGALRELDFSGEGSVCEILDR